jgi:hypothetical protein
MLKLCRTCKYDWDGHCVEGNDYWRSFKQRKMTNARITKGGTRMLKLKKLRMPLPVTINDCVLLWQMGYRVEINDGRVIAVVKESKKKTALKPH